MTPTNAAKVLATLEQWAALIKHQYTGTSEGMSALQDAALNNIAAITIMREEVAGGCLSNCDTCEYHQSPAHAGHCYMFYEEPQGVCAKWKDGNAKFAAPQAPAEPIYYMRDNHTFKKLSEDVPTALIEIEAEFNAGYTSGMLCSKRPGFEGIHAGGSRERVAFLSEVRALLEKAR